MVLDARGDVFENWSVNWMKYSRKLEDDPALKNTGPPREAVAVYKNWSTNWMKYCRKSEVSHVLKNTGRPERPREAVIVYKN